LSVFSRQFWEQTLSRSSFQDFPTTILTNEERAKMYSFLRRPSAVKTLYPVIFLLKNTINFQKFSAKFSNRSWVIRVQNTKMKNPPRSFLELRGGLFIAYQIKYGVYYRRDSNGNTVAYIKAKNSFHDCLEVSVATVLTAVDKFPDQRRNYAVSSHKGKNDIS
jgi:hypothetical protein